MAALTALDIQDLVASTLYDLGPMRFQQVAQSLQYYEVFSKWFKKDRVMFDSGIGIQRTLMNKLDSVSAKHVGLTDTRQREARRPDRHRPSEHPRGPRPAADSVAARADALGVDLSD
jgi:hypothetical protein